MVVSKIPERERVPGPPVGWRPRTLTIAEKLQVVVNQAGREWTHYVAGQLLDGPLLEPMKGGGIHFDHQPAIQERRWDPELEDTIPPSCDLHFIVALNKVTHGVKTAKRDIKEIAKTRRLERGPKAKRPWPKAIKKRRPGRAPR